uniref:uncharacterized protein isoform X2 n=1 Tax=Semicossyphus pulcher TaxID=241346 RepID=UPI0037E9127E
MLLLLCFLIIAGIKAEERPTMHYRVKGGSLCLHVGNSQPYQYVRWYFNENLIVVEKSITPNYKEKVDYNPMNHSLCINKLTETDSGFYKVSFADENFTESTEIHKLILQVNCSVLRDWVLALCDEDSCRTVQRSFSTINITVSADRRSVVCIGNNHVSTDNATESMAATCYSKSIDNQEESPQPLNLKVIAMAIAIIVTLCLFIACLAINGKTLCSAQCNHHQTSPAHCIQSQPIEAQPQPVSSDSTSSSQPDAYYENVEAPQPNQTSSPKVEIGSKQSQTVDTLYSVLQLPHRTDSHGKSASSNDTTVHKPIQEASTSVTLGEAEQPMQVDTVYSRLQKPER